ncbi:uncharacterized protein [Euphorbia lathyris]|uniref:uncharacterized protein n=1 Tax=Euphorbia lathyris TaxID=212925 RepID=UPI0033142BB9
MTKPSYLHVALTSQTDGGNKSGDDSTSQGNKSGRSGGNDEGIVLVFRLLAGNSNYIPWSHSMIHALRAKRKLMFIMEEDLKPSISAPDYEKWCALDSLVFSWLINSMEKDVALCFIYATSARALWKEAEQRFAEKNGLQLFHLKQELSIITQGSLSISSYFLRLKRIWDEITALQPSTACTCGESKQIIQDLDGTDRVMKFLS